MSTIGTQILEQIARIKEAKNKISAAAAALLLEKLSLSETLNMTLPNGIEERCQTEQIAGAGDEYILQLKFNDVATCTKFKNDSAMRIYIYKGSNVDAALHYENGGNNTIKSVASNSVDTDTLTYIFVAPSSLSMFSIGLYQEAVDDMAVTVTVNTRQRFRTTDKLAQLIEAMDLIGYHEFETITENGSLTKGYYHGCEVNVAAEGCNHVQTEAFVDLAAGNVIFKDMSGNVLETSVYDANDIENDRYVVNEVHVENIPDTTALEQQIDTLETELENINTELAGM